MASGIPAYVGSWGRAIDLNNEGVRLSNKNKLPEAEAAFKESIRLKKEAFGPDSTHVAIGYMGLADVYLSWNKLDEAEKWGKEALRIREAARDPETRYSRELLADVAAARKKQAQRAAAAAAAAAGASDSGGSAAGAEAAGPVPSAQPPEPRAHACQYCGKAESPATGRLKRCSACKLVFYCSPECQQADWKGEGGHKRACKQTQKSKSLCAAMKEGGMLKKGWVAWGMDPPPT